MTLVDSHCHLDFEDFETERDEIIQRARSSGVQTMLTICTHVNRMDRILAVAEHYDQVFCSVGLHPNHVDEHPKVELEDLLKWAAHEKVVGIGETGLDYYYDYADTERQVRSFRTHIAAARETGLPVIIHSREAEDDTAAILKEEMGQGAFPGVLHCFSSHQRLAEVALELGLYVSFAGIVTFKNAKDLQETARMVPLDRILVETDCPYLAPVPKRGKRNEPSFVVHTAEKLAELKEMSTGELSEATTDNFYRLFNKATRN